MSFDNPYYTPTLLRSNAYERICAHCNKVVNANTGVAFLLWNEFKQKNTWHAAHGTEYDSADFCADGGQPCFSEMLKGASKASASYGPVAAKQVAEAKDAEALVEALATAPAFTMPDAIALEPLLAKLMDASVTAIVQDVAAQFTETVPPMVADLLAQARPVQITVGDRPTVTVTQKHKALEDVLLMVAAGTSPFLVGPAGSGKTTLAQQVAECMSLPFYMASRVTSEYKLTGFVDANGKVTRTAFREAYEHGGVFLFDEVDASDADALTSFNAALAGQLADFPDCAVVRHNDFHAIAAGNTFGRGADRQYVGRNQLDAATLDRFQVYEVDYDEELEQALCGNAEWCAFVQKVRAAIDTEKVRHVVSPRASISGAKLLAAGFTWDKVEDICVWKGLDAEQRRRVTARMGGL